MDHQLSLQIDPSQENRRGRNAGEIGQIAFTNYL
jgi:hypothetical protein